MPRKIIDLAIKDNKLEVDEFKKKFKKAVKKYGVKRIVNYDETSFKNLCGQIRTIVPKNSKKQPRIKNNSKGNGMSIGLLITASGEKLKSILVTSGKTKLSLKKYEHYQQDNRCILTMSSEATGFASKSGWFRCEAPRCFALHIFKCLLFLMLLMNT